MRNKLFSGGILAFVLVFGMAVVGCDDGSTDNKTIDSKFHGKWEVESILYQGTTYTLPCLFMGVQIKSAGYEISLTSVKTYGNGIVTQNVGGIYSDGNSFYNSAGQSGFSMQVNGNNATIITTLETDYCKKVSKFSWE